MKNDIIMIRDNRKRLFEMMERVAGMTINENLSLLPPSPPPGFTSDDFMSLDDFLKNDEVINEYEVDDYTISNKDDVKSVLQQRHQEYQKGIPLTRDRELPFLFGKFVEGIVDDEGNEWDLEKLKHEITKHPAQLLSKPEKMAKTNAWSVSLPATVGIIFNERIQKFEIVITCPKAGRCKKDCFAWKGNYIRVPDVSLHRLKMLNYVVNHWDLFEKRLLNEIESKELINTQEGLGTLIRWHDSGDFFSEKYLLGAFGIAEKTPNVQHYAYTKSIGMISGQNIPPNFFFRFSFGGLQDKLIDKIKTPYADILYPNEFENFIKKHKSTDTAEGGWFFHNDDAKEGLRKYVANKYGVELKDVLYVPELEKIQYDSENSIPKWTVIVTPKDSDVGGYRKDVLGTILLYH